jgi:hypothetical protein
MHDTVRWDYAVIRPRHRKAEGTSQPRAGHRPRRDEWLKAHLIYEAVRQRSTRVVLVDVVLGCLRWGADRYRWPSNWRSALLKVVRRVVRGPSGDGAAEDGPARRRRTLPAAGRPGSARTPARCTASAATATGA